ncbi:MAG: hypothetical protein JWR09_487 [Mucilaginibacter sp.]|nr:hypothetical protein [Mucilaginibacter sp.]
MFYLIMPNTLQDAMVTLNDFLHFLKGFKITAIPGGIMGLYI